MDADKSTLEKTKELDKKLFYYKELVSRLERFNETPDPKLVLKEGQLRKNFSNVYRPKKGWINEIRTSLDIPLRRLGQKVMTDKGKPTSPQGIIELEASEVEGKITIKSLKKIADALDMDLVYGFAPKQESVVMWLYRKIKPEAKERFYDSIIESIKEGVLKPKRVQDHNQTAIRNEALDLLRNMSKSVWDKI